MATVVAAEEKGEGSFTFVAIWCFSISLPIRCRLHIAKNHAAMRECLRSRNECA